MHYYTGYTRSLIIEDSLKSKSFIIRDGFCEYTLQMVLTGRGFQKNIIFFADRLLLILTKMAWEAATAGQDTYHVYKTYLFDPKGRLIYMSIRANKTLRKKFWT
jgi:hypothetical protein